MASLMVVHLTGEDRGKTFIFEQEAITLGPDTRCDLPLDIPAVSNGNDESARAVVAEIYRRHTNFDLFFRDPLHYSLSINRESKTVDESGGPIPIFDGDILSLHAVDTSDLRLPTELLMHVVHEMDQTNPGVRNTRLQFPEVDRGGRLHPRTASRFARELILALYAEIPPWTRVIAVALTILLPVLLLTSTAIVFYGVIRYYEILNTFEKLGKDAGKQIEQLLIKNKELEDKVKELNQLLNSGQSIAQSYSAGVCLIQGTYTYTHRESKRPLRYLDRSFNQGAAVGPDGNLQVSFDGTGDVYMEEFSGTGFVFSEGRILTNRHISQPWWGDQSDRVIMESLGGAPQIKQLFGYFPGLKAPIELTPVKFSTDSDVALCSFDPQEFDIPVLPLAESIEDKDITGQTIVLLGYPSGVDGLLEQLSDENIKETIRRRPSRIEWADELQRLGYLRPKVTQGHVTQFFAGRLIHDAATTDGGSGSPILNTDGKVIGINAQILVNADGPVPGSNIGVPIRAAAELVRTVEEAK